MRRVGLVILLASGIVTGSRADMDMLASGQTDLRDRSLVDQYCLGCHNDRLKTGGLTLEGVDVRDVHGNAEILEKVVRKLRSGQMPPKGSRQPDTDSAIRFVTTLEAALDGAAEATPNPGRIPA